MCIDWRCRGESSDFNPGENVALLFLSSNPLSDRDRSKLLSHVKKGARTPEPRHTNESIPNPQQGKVSFKNRETRITTLALSLPRFFLQGQFFKKSARTYAWNILKTPELSVLGVAACGRGQLCATIRRPRGRLRCVRRIAVIEV